MKVKTYIKPALAMAALLPLSGLAAETSGADILIKEAPHRIYHVIQNKTLAQAANQIAKRSGISFRINAANQNDIISKKIAAEDWKAALAQLLPGYNYSTELENGRVKTVIVTGENGSGNKSAALVQILPNQANNVPGQYKHLNPGSVMPLDLPLAQMKATPVGKKLTLDLPIGQYKIKHDNFVDHGDGTSTWMGYMDEEGKGYRFYLSEGESGLMGNIYTPDGAYNIEQANGETVLVDLNHSGLQTAGYDNDQAPAPYTLQPLINAPVTGGRQQSAAALATKAGTSTAKAAAAAANTGPVVDLMVLYTTKRQTAAYAKQRIRYLVDVSNQAYADSKINMRLRLVHTRSTTYSESNSNTTALNDLTKDAGAFKGTAALRTQYGADVVALLRPLYAQSAGGCGMTWVGFSSGSAADARYGYGTIGDGSSKDISGYYCDTSTFPHEIGHLFGNVHDREYSSFPGKFSYSYAWGVQGKFGTIMSYKSPSLMLFSTPLLAAQCKGAPCGYPEGNSRSSDQARTINSTASSVSNYRPKKVTNAVIQ